MKSALLMLLCVWMFSAGAHAQETQSPEKTDAAIGEVFASDASAQGTAVRASSGTSLFAGSTVDAGTVPALVKLRRGGTVRVCPGSSLSVNTAQNGLGAEGEDRQSGLMLSLDTGAIEADYKLAAAADTLVTPDFRILLSGPGVFHVAVSADARGNTCVRTLPGNTAALVVSELMGAGSYQVKPAESVYFAAGQVAKASAQTGACGCAAAQVGTETAQAVKPTLAPPAIGPQRAAVPAENPVVPPPHVNNTGSETQPVPPAKPGEVQVQVDAPFVFRAVEPGPSVGSVASLRLNQTPDLPQAEVLAPQAATAGQASAPVAQKKAKRGFFGRLGRFFAVIFGKR